MPEKVLLQEHSSTDSKVSRTIEAHSINYIPERERHGSARQQALFWFIPNFNIFGVALGLIGPGLGLSLWWTILAGAAGAIVGGFFVSFHASQGPQLGLPQMIQSRAQFGYRGVLIPTLVVLVNFLAFNVLQTDMLKSGLASIFGWNPILIVLCVSIVAALLAIFGHDWLHKTFRILFWCCVPLFVMLTIGIVSSSAGAQAVPESQALSFDFPAFLAVFAVAMSYQLALAPYISDYTRYLPSKTKTRHIILAVQSGICISLIWLMGIGAWLSINFGTTDAVVGLSEAGNSMFPFFGTITAVLAMLGLVAVIGTNTYSAGIGVATAIDCIRPISSTRRLRVLATVGLLVVWGTVNLNIEGDISVLITNLLNALLYLLVPWTAVNLVDFFIVRKGNYAITEIIQRNGIYGNWAWQGLAAYGLGLAIEVPFMNFSFYQGAGYQLIGFDISFIFGLIISGGAYLLLSPTLDLASERAAIAQSGETPEQP